MKRIVFCENRSIVERYLDKGYLSQLETRFELVFDALSLNVSSQVGDVFITCMCASPGVFLYLADTVLTESPVLCIVDGALEWSNVFENTFYSESGYSLYQDEFFDCFLCANDGQVREFRSMNLPAQRISFLSANFYNELTGANKVLVTTANQPYLDMQEYSILRKELIRICRFCELLRVEFNLRIFDFNLQNDLRSYMSLNRIDEPFEEVIGEYGVLVTTPSTISLTAFEKSIPVVHIDYRSGPLLFQSGWRHLPGASLGKLVRSLNDKDRLAYQRRQVSVSADSYSVEWADLKPVNINKRRLIKMILKSSFNFNFELRLRRWMNRLFSLVPGFANKRRMLRQAYIRRRLKK